MRVYIKEMELDKAPMGITKFFETYPDGDYMDYLSKYRYCLKTLKEIKQL